MISLRVTRVPRMVNADSWPKRVDVRKAIGHNGSTWAQAPGHQEPGKMAPVAYNQIIQLEIQIFNWPMTNHQTLGTSHHPKLTICSKNSNLQCKLLRRTWISKKQQDSGIEFSSLNNCDHTLRVCVEQVWAGSCAGGGWMLHGHPTR